MTTLSESKERWPPEPIEEEPFASSREKWDAWVWLVKGAVEALDREVAAETNGPMMGMIDLENDTAPPMVERDAITYPQDLVEAFRLRIQRIDEWEKDPRDWGPGPFDYPEHFDATPTRSEGDE